MDRPTHPAREDKARATTEPTAPAIVSSKLVRTGAGTSATPAAAALADAAAAILPGERQTLIAQAAYFLAERRGFSPGHELEDWLAAEQDVERALQQGSRA